MPTCIYCRFAGPESFPREHVIPYALGRFRKALTLGCVCGVCNEYFGRCLDRPFASESAESIARFRHGLRDMKSAKRSRTVRARANVPGPIRGAKVLLRPDATAKSGIGNVYVPQVGFKNPNELDWRWYTLEELNSEVAQTVEPGSGLKFFLAAEEGEHDEEKATSKMREQEGKFRSRLRELGLVGETQQISRDRLPPTKDFKTRVTCDFDFNMSRCVAKIAFNYFACVLDENADLLLRHNFDAVRKYVREGIFPDYPVVSFSNRPRFDPEPEKPPFVNGHVLAVGWDVTNENIGCALSLFNTMSYRVVLCRKYDGLWFALRHAHAFDFETREVRSIPVNLLPAPISV